MSALTTSPLARLVMGSYLGASTFVGAAMISMAVTEKTEIRSSLKTCAFIASVLFAEGTLLSIIEDTPTAYWVKVGAIGTSVLFGAGGSSVNLSYDGNEQAKEVIIGTGVGSFAAFALWKLYNPHAALVGGISAAHLSVQFIHYLTRRDQK